MTKTFFFFKCYGVVRNNENRISFLFRDGENHTFINVKYPGLSNGLNFEQNAAEIEEIQTNSGYVLISKCRLQKAEIDGV